MPVIKRPRKGSLQFYPRKRAAKFVPSVNWKPIAGEGVLGFIAYKVGMATAIVKDSTPKTMASGKQISLPVTILEVPNMKVYSVRFYKDGQVLKETVVSKDKELKRILKAPKELPNFDSAIPQAYDDIRIIAYSIPSQTHIKKTPDIIELAVGAKNKLEFVKTIIGKELSLPDLLKSPFVDVRGLTIGKGLQGPVARFGISLRQHKSEKGVRRPGSLGPWHPARVTYYTPMAGQLGMFTRVHYNLKVLGTGKIAEKDINPPSGFRHYGKIHSSYIVVKGSVQGPPKRQILLTTPFRLTRDNTKLQYELLELHTF
ncbi:MAG: 50S ribosomal protein L3 [Nanoarchaeota archaeon]|nr:50S ribosomal protein L3 [Nanoarchaeota archaeon]